MITICEWPNGDWCYLSDLEEYLTWHSDDFMYKTLSEEEFEKKYNE